MEVHDTQERHSQLFEADLDQKMVVSAKNLIIDNIGRVLRMTNGFGYFCRNKSSYYI